MKNEKLIPFEIIEKAITGEADAIDTVLRHYIPQIKYQGHINDEIQDRLKAKLMNAVLQFQFDR